MNDKEYWQTRASQRELMGEKTAEELLLTMKPVYKNCLVDINKEIEAFYGRYAENNQLTLTEVHKRLDPKELKSAKEEIKKYYDDIDRLARDSSGKVDVNLLRQYKDELRLQSAKAYMSRLEELKLNLKNITVNLGVKESEAYYQTLSKIYSDTYKKTSYDMDKFFGFSAGFEGLNYKKLNSAIHQQWLGMNFSDRIWNNKGKLLDQINTTFLQGVAQGHNPRKIAESMAKNMGTSYYNCERLARTECAHIAGEATLQGYKDRGTERYKFDATLDDRTSDICQSLDGEVFYVKEAQEGVNYPPMHPNCRSTTIPYFEPDDIDKMFDEAQRVARNEDGELYYVPASMTYKEWEKTIAGNGTPIDYPILTENPKSDLRTDIENQGVESRKVDLLSQKLSEDEIIDRISGGDRTKGSCSSLSFAYVANKAGFDVLDFRDGLSRSIFAKTKNIIKIAKLNGVESYTYESSNDFTSAKKLLEHVKTGKEYVLAVGKHSAIIRKQDNGFFQYLELQSQFESINGWTGMGSMEFQINDILKRRFACQKTHTYYGHSYKIHNALIDVESLGKNAEFIKLMQYINTDPAKQNKGIGGGIK